jgi:hypothetical protein
MFSITNITLSFLLVLSVISNSLLLFAIANPVSSFGAYGPKVQRSMLRTKISDEDLQAFTPEMLAFYEDVRDGRLLGKDVTHLSFPEDYFFESVVNNMYCWHLFRTDRNGSSEGTVLYLLSDRTTSSIVSSGTVSN